MPDLYPFYRLIYNHQVTQPERNVKIWQCKDEGQDQASN